MRPDVARDPLVEGRWDEETVGQRQGHGIEETKSAGWIEHLSAFNVLRLIHHCLVHGSVPVPLCPFVSLSLCPSLFVEEGLEDEDGGYLVDDALVILASVSSFVEELMSFPGGETLVPQVNGQAGEVAQLGGKLLRLRGA